MNPWAITEGTLEKAQKLANIVGCPTAVVEEMVKCLKTRPARQIARADMDFMVNYNLRKKKKKQK